MIKFNKGFYGRTISIIVAVSFLVTTNVYPDALPTSPPPHLRKQLDFNNREKIILHYLFATFTVWLEKITIEELKKQIQLSGISTSLINNLESSNSRVQAEAAAAAKFLAEPGLLDKGNLQDRNRFVRIGESCARTIALLLPASFRTVEK